MVMIVTGYFFCLFTGIPNLDALHAEYYEDPQRTTEDHQHHLMLMLWYDCGIYCYTVITVIYTVIYLFISVLYLV